MPHVPPCSQMTPYSVLSIQSIMLIVSLSAVPFHHMSLQADSPFFWSVQSSLIPPVLQFIPLVPPGSLFFWSLWCGSFSPSGSFLDLCVSLQCDHLPPSPLPQSFPSPSFMCPFTEAVCSSGSFLDLCVSLQCGRFPPSGPFTVRPSCVPSVWQFVPLVLSQSFMCPSSVIVCPTPWFFSGPSCVPLV